MNLGIDGGDGGAQIFYFIHTVQWPKGIQSALCDPLAKDNMIYSKYPCWDVQ